MPILNRQPLRRQIVVAAGVLLCLLAAAILWSAKHTRDERQAEVRAEASSIATVAAVYLNHELDDIDHLAALLAQHPAVLSFNSVECERLFKAIVKDRAIILNVVLADATGIMKGSALTPVDRLGQRITLPYVEEVLTSGKRFVSDFAIGQSSGKPMIVLAYPLRNKGGSLIGILSFGLALTELQSVFSGIPLPAGSVVTLYDEAGRVMVRTRDAEKYIGRFQPEMAKLRPTAQVTMLTGIDGVDRFYGVVPIARGPWLLTVGIPRAEVLNRLSALWERSLIIVGGAITVVLLLSLWHSHHTSRGLTVLRSAVRRIADGDLSPPAKMSAPNREIDDLQAAFTTMAANLRETHVALDRQIEQERKMRETLQSLQLQVVRQERLAAVGVLVSGVAHELNNPLQAILGTAELLEMSGDVGPASLEEVETIKTQSGRAREIIRNLSRFSNQQSGPPSTIDLRDVISEVVQLRRQDLEASSITLDVETSSGRKVLANFTEIEQVTLNFVINAQHAVESTGRNKGRILIKLYDTGKRVRLEVHDNGPGVATDNEPKLFQPFFTTKPVGKGTGLGLSVSYGIIDSYGGSIGYARSEWGGATFFFELPGVEIQPNDDRAPVLRRSVSPGV